jgi:hypothetical protein
MYQDKLAVAIKHNGKVLREDSDKVYVPFGSEYTILIKNLNSVKCQFRIFIDGEDATGPLVVMPNTSSEIERFIKNNNFEKGNRFKFIEKTQQISDFRGDKVDDGLIRIEYQFEKKRQRQDGFQINDYWWNGIPKTPNYDNAYGGSFTKTHTVGNVVDSAMMNSGIIDANMSQTSVTYGVTDQQKSFTRSMNTVTTASMNAVNTVVQSAASDKGITVPGSESDQKFVYTSAFALEAEKHVMVLKLVGEVAGQVIEKPVTVNTKPDCSTCGRKNRATNKFCVNCGTSLTIF